MGKGLSELCSSFGSRQFGHALKEYMCFIKKKKVIQEDNGKLLKLQIMWLACALYYVHIFYSDEVNTVMKHLTFRCKINKNHNNQTLKYLPRSPVAKV